MSSLLVGSRDDRRALTALLHRTNAGAPARIPQRIARSADAAARRARNDCGMGKRSELRELEITFADVWLVCAIAVTFLIAISLVAYRLAS
jgi:hypothetical protein